MTSNSFFAMTRTPCEAHASFLVCQGVPTSKTLCWLAAMMEDERGKALCKTHPLGGSTHTIRLPVTAESQAEGPRYNVLRICSGMHHYPFLNSTDFWTDKYLMGGEVSRAFWNGKLDEADGNTAET